MTREERDVPVLGMEMKEAIESQEVGVPLKTLDTDAESSPGLNSVSFNIEEESECSLYMVDESILFTVSC